MSAPNLRRPVVSDRVADAQRDEVAVELEVGDDHARREMHLRAEDRVADVIEMRHLAAVEEDAVLDLARIADDRARADDDVLADVGAVANLAVRPDPRRALDVGAGLDHRALADVDVLADDRLADEPAVVGRDESVLEIVRPAWAGFPRPASRRGRARRGRSA